VQIRAQIAVAVVAQVPFADVHGNAHSERRGFAFAVMRRKHVFVHPRGVRMHSPGARRGQPLGRIADVGRDGHVVGVPGVPRERGSVCSVVGHFRLPRCAVKKYWCFRNYGGKVKIEGFAIAVDLKEGRTPNGVRVESGGILRSTERCTPNGVQKHQKLWDASEYFLLFLKTQDIGVFLGAPQDIVLGEGFGLRDDGFVVIKLPSDDLKPSN
jgi:hypothetical protein